MISKGYTLESDNEVCQTCAEQMECFLDFGDEITHIYGSSDPDRVSVYHVLNSTVILHLDAPDKQLQIIGMSESETNAAKSKLEKVLEDYGLKLMEELE